MSHRKSGDDPVFDNRVLVGTGAFHVWPVVALIWRTVDVGRTVDGLGLAPEPIDDDEVLGARGVLVKPPDGPPVVVLEPATEGRLAAALARDDEGESGTYTAPAGGLEEALDAGYRVIAEGAGPFGRSALVDLPEGVHATRFLVIVPAPAATIGE